jgi:peptide/nickel transport system substrate-binding protein
VAVSPYRAASALVDGGAGGGAAVRALDAMRETTDPEEVIGWAAEVDRALFDTLYGVPLVARAGAVVASGAVDGVGYTAAETSAPTAFWTWTPSAE